METIEIDGHGTRWKRYEGVMVLSLLDEYRIEVQDAGYKRLEVPHLVDEGRHEWYWNWHWPFLHRRTIRDYTAAHARLAEDAVFGPFEDTILARYVGIYFGGMGPIQIGLNRLYAVRGGDTLTIARDWDIFLS